RVFNVSEFSDVLQVGNNVLAFHLMDADTSPIQDLLLAPMLTLSAGVPLEPSLVGGMIAATPGGPNTNVLASDVQFSRVGGVFSDPFMLVLSSSNPGEVIRYTTDGTKPTTDSAVYTAPIQISSTVKIRARAF